MASRYSLELGSESPAPMTQLPVQGISPLPNELFSEIIRLLGPRYIKQARLVCHHWSREGRRWLFRRVFFRPDEAIMNLFNKITANPDFAVGVEEVVYDARQFCRFIENQDYWIAYKERFPPSDGYISNGHEMVTNRYIHGIIQSSHRYRQLFEEQDKIFNEGRDFQALSDGLKQLPSLRTITILDQLPGKASRKHREGDSRNFAWYHSLTEKVWKDTIPPMSMTQAEENWDSPIDHIEQWTHRGIGRLLKAISIYKIPIETLHCGWPSSGLHLEPFLKLVWPDDDDFAESTYTISPHLETIIRNLTCMTLSFHHDKYVSYDEASTPERLIVMGIVEHAKNLRSLGITLKRSSSVWSTIMSSASWPHLTVLELGRWSLKSDDLRGFCYEHKDTLRKLSLLSIELEHGGTRNSWEDVGKELGEFLRLDFVGLHSLRNSVPSSALFRGEIMSRVSMARVGTLLCSRVPTARLIIGSKEGISMLSKKS